MGTGKELKLVDEFAEHGLTLSYVAGILRTTIDSDNPKVRLAALAELRAWRKEIREELSALGKLQESNDLNTGQARDVQERLKAIDPEDLKSARKIYIAN